MKILHTSDLHFGRSLGSVSLHAHQEAFVDWLLATIDTHGIELLVVAGDLYDRSIPPTESVALWRQVLQSAAARGVAVAAIAGNHDGADRVAAHDGLTDAARIYVRGGYERAGEVIRLEFPDGPLDVVAVPFLDPQAAPPEWKAAFTERDETRTHASVLGAALDTARSSLAEVGSARSLAIVHAFVAGSSESDSERQLSVGGTDRVGSELLDGFSYVALGHLHTPQIIGGTDTIRYSGTPLPYSFSETAPKSVVIIDMAPDGTCSIVTEPVPVGRRVASITGTIEELLAPDSHPEAIGCYVRATLTNATYVTDAKSRLSDRYPHIIDVVMSLSGSTVELGGDGVPVQQRRSPLEEANEFWSTVVGSEVSPLQLEALTDVLNEVFTGSEGVA
jgi:exonuclease SbcD